MMWGKQKTVDVDCHVTFSPSSWDELIVTVNYHTKVNDLTYSLGFTSDENIDKRRNDIWRFIKNCNLNIISLTINIKETTIPFFYSYSTFIGKEKPKDFPYRLIIE